MAKSSADKDKLKKFGIYGAALAGVGLVVAGGSYGVCMVQSKIALNRAEAQLKRGFAALAAETLDPRHKEVIRFERGCQVLIAANYQARKPERLEWASQACLEAGKDIPEAYMGIAGAREIAGKDNEALQVLGNVLTKFDKIPDIYYSMAQILKRLKKDDQATIAFQRAIERAPENKQLKLEAMEYWVSVNRWADARPYADQLKAVETENPEVKLFLARILVKNGDKASADPLIAQARELLAKKPEIKDAIEKGYADLLQGDAHRNVASQTPNAGGSK